MKKIEIKKNKPKIALIVDVKNWCFWNIAEIVKENLKGFYDFEIIPLSIIEDNIVRLLFYAKKFDLVHFFWRGHLTYINEYHPRVIELGMKYEEFYKTYVESLNITTAIYDHLYLDNIEVTNQILEKCKNYTVSSKKLFKIYNENQYIIKKPEMMVTDGVDLSIFKPRNLERFKEKRALVIGWVGNSEWASEKEDFKGFNTILKPAIKELLEENCEIKTLFADRKEGMIPHDEMPKYYSKIDVLVCVSKIEGTPNPVLEAMACGVPIISTDVGIVNDAFGKKQKEFILPERNKENLKKTIKKLVNNKKALTELSNENLVQIQKWDWKIITKKFKNFFDNNLNNKI